MRKLALASSSIATMLIGGFLVAQQPNRTQQPSTTNPATSAPQNRESSKDEIIAHCLALDNQAEIALSQFAKQKSQNKEVQEFATTMQQDHQNFLTKLQQLAPQTARLKLDEGDQPGRRDSVNRESPTNDAATTQKRTQGQASTVGNITASPNQPGLSGDYNQLQQEVAQQCLSDAKQYLSEKSAAEFDRCYMTMQAMMHAGMKSKLTVFNRHATGELKNVVASGLQTVEKHLKHAEKILDNLEGDSATKSARKPD